MFLRKNLLGLFFFSFCGMLFSQGKQLELVNQNLVDYTYDNNQITYESVNENEGVSNNYIQLLDSFTSLAIESEGYELHILNINSKNSDYAPFFHNEELVFSSSRNTRSISKSYDEENKQPFSDLYIATNKSDKEVIKKVKGNINTRFHESSAIFSKDGTTAYFTRNNYVNHKWSANAAGEVLLKIYKATNKNGKWVNVEELPFCSDEYSVAHPALSADGNVLYFASDMPGSYGKSDLYAVEIFEDGTFGTPYNLGGQINTPGRETFPFVSDKGNLFFASDGHIGYGNLDVYMVLHDKNAMSKAYNLGYPINGPQDDFTFVINEENKVGYFASNRDGGEGNDDIYGFRQLVPFPESGLNKPKTMKKMERIMNIKEKDVEITSW